MIGHRFANTNYALAHALGGANELRWIMLSYSMWCSYCANLKRHFAKHFPQAAALLDKIRGNRPAEHRSKERVQLSSRVWMFRG